CLLNPTSPHPPPARGHGLAARHAATTSSLHFHRTHARTYARRAGSLPPQVRAGYRRCVCVYVRVRRLARVVRPLMRPARRGWGVGALARAFLVLLLLLLAAATTTTIGFGCRGAEAIRVIPPHGPAPGSARSSRGHGHRRSHGNAARVVDAAMPVVGTRPVPALSPAADEESKRRIPSCPDPLHNR
ncbi:Os01g0509400, partial [Oryza sativa Japonica Group]